MYKKGFCCTSVFDQRPHNLPGCRLSNHSSAHGNDHRRRERSPACETRPVTTVAQMLIERRLKQKSGACMNSDVATISVDGVDEFGSRLVI